MANKTLKATVKLDTKSAEASLTRLTKKINNVQNAIKNTSGNNTKLTTSINKAVSATQKLNNTTNKVAANTQRVANTANKVNTANQRAANSARKMRDGYTASNTAATKLLRTLKSIAGTYLGIMAARGVINASDTITSSENRLNNLPGGNPQLTQESMDKMYVAAQRSRSAYSDMLSNVSKTMTLAGDSFDNNIDNAIKFQEIMAKAYTVGGATAAEQSSSMYQLVQALGSGILQGDELRSVREGAPLAYKAIEEFAQGVLNTEDSLKDLASQGLITSDMVVAAIMNMENGVDNINDKFENTQMTFAQAWTSIKNMALQAFRPVLQIFNDVLNSDAGKAIINGIGRAFVWLANAILWVGDILSSFFNWCAENWSWLQYVVIFALAAIATYLIYTAGVSIVSAIASAIAWMMVHWQLVAIILVIALLVTGIIWLANTTASGCEFMIRALAMVGLAIMLIGLITGSTAIIIVGIVIALIALFLAFAQQIIGAAYWCGALIMNTIYETGNVFHAVANFMGAVWINCVNGMINVGNGLWNALCAVAENIGIAFENAWIFAQNSFWSFIESVLNGISALEPVINKLAELAGNEGFSLSEVIADVSGKQQSYKSYVSVGDAWDSGMNTNSYVDVGEAWASGMNTYEYINLGDAYANGAQVGANLQDAVGNWGSNIKDKISGAGGFGDLGNLANGIGDPLSGSYLPGINDPAYGLNGGYDPNAVANSLGNIDDGVGSIDDKVGNIADSMDLSNDDLEYLRKIADMEWRNEFTTAEIRVDMTNNNTVTAERDLDGIVEYLSDVLRSEMTNVAYGVHY